MIDRADLPPSPVPPELISHLTEVQQVARNTLGNIPEVAAWRAQMSEIARPMIEALEMTASARRVAADFAENFRALMPPDGIPEARRLIEELQRQRAEIQRSAGEFQVDVPRSASGQPLSPLALVLAWLTLDTWVAQLPDQDLGDLGRSMWVLAAVLFWFAMTEPEKTGA